MSDSIADCAAREERARAAHRSGPTRTTPEQTRAARREAMTEHERLVEDLVDQYTAAVKDDEVRAYFVNIATQILTLRSAGQKISNFVKAATRLDASARDASAALKNLIDRLNDLNENATKGGD